MKGEYKVVSKWVFDPTDSLFKQPANAKAECKKIYCKLDKCPLREKKSCTFAPSFGLGRCPYGKITREEGPTRRAKSYRGWIDKKKNEDPDIGKLGNPAKKLAFIGEYVYLPYYHMTMNKGLPFVQHSSAFVSGSAFIRRSEWTIKTVLSLIDFCPHALMGGEIKSYQRESIPLFIRHLRELDGIMWEQLISERPEYDKTPDHIGRKAFVRTLNRPIEWDTKHPKYTVSWKWDGEFLYSTSRHAYNSIWGEVDMESVEIKGVPAENATIEVKNNDWVNNDTKFFD